MDIESQLHIASEIESEADTENLDSYEDRIHHYKNLDYTYIPITGEELYYDVEEGWTKNINPDQYIREDTHLIDVLKKLQDFPFVLVDHRKGGSYAVHANDLMEADFPEDELPIPLSEISDGSDRVLIPYDVLEEHLPDRADDLIIIELSYRYGIITIADINRRPVRDMLYKVFSELSSQLSNKIENKYPDSESILRHLRPATVGYWWKDQERNLGIHVAEHMNLLEMMQVIQSSNDDFVKSCGFNSKNDVNSLQSINDIRNKVMHGNRSLIYDRRDIQDVLDSVYDAQGVITNID